MTYFALLSLTTVSIQCYRYSRSYFHFSQAQRLKRVSRRFIKRTST